MTNTVDEVEADRALKDRHRAMWALGNYPAPAHDLISELGPTLVTACRVRSGDRVLDVAAGSGNAAIPVALAGAGVVASDLTPELFDAGRAQATERGAELERMQGDAEALPFADGEFDTVLSCVGVMFAPHHQAAADELVRVCRPGVRNLSMVTVSRRASTSVTRELVELARRHDQGAGGTVMNWEYLLLTARKGT